MTTDQLTGPDQDTARILLEIDAVTIRPDQPFTFTSGWASPVYIDCRRLISFPSQRRRVLEKAFRAITDEIGCEWIDAIAGGETAGIPYAAWLAEQANKPMLYVRKQAKGFGRTAQIEGTFDPGDRVLLVEDLATDGKSKLTFAAALRQAGATVDHALVIFFYGIFPGVTEALAVSGLRLHFLATWWDVLAVAEASGRYDRSSLAEVRGFLEDPVSWSAAHGGRSAL